MVKKSLKIDKKDKTEDRDLEIENLKNQIARTLADYQNLEKRTVQEREELRKSANSGLILRLLPALDTLMLAQKHTKDEGINLSIQLIFDTLEREGLKKIETQGHDFDPQFMEAVHVVEVDPSADSASSLQAGSGQGEGKVIEELRSGFLLNDKVLRAAQVSVGHAI